MNKGAIFSGCYRYRYRLWREWDTGPRVLFVMLNPSTADATEDDSTIRKCIGFATRWGAGRLDVVNLYAWRATQPTDLKDLKDAQGPVGEYSWLPWQRPVRSINRNDVAIAQAADRADRIIAAWGAWPGPIEWRARQVLEDLLLPHGPVEALRLTKHGHPHHPVRLGYDVEPVPYLGGPS